jgi:Na+-driven multidrug efflux pump
LEWLEVAEKQKNDANELFQKKDWDNSIKEYLKVSLRIFFSFFFFSLSYFIFAIFSIELIF